MSPARRNSQDDGRRPAGRVILLLAFILALALTLVPTAVAERGVEGVYKFPILESEPGIQLSSPRDVAVSGDGAGDAEPGDFYIADQGNFFGSTGQSINQYAADGSLRRALGRQCRQRRARAGRRNAVDRDLRQQRQLQAQLRRRVHRRPRLRRPRGSCRGGA